MDRSEVSQLLSEILGNDADRRGWVLYSGLDTITRGSFYFMGFNPREDDANRPLIETINHDRNWSAYTQQCWKRGCQQPRCKHIDLGGRLKEFERHQTNVNELAALLNAKPEWIFSANAIFVESRTARDLKDVDKLWQKCWRVHQRFLARVRPKWIVCLGNGEELSSFQLLKLKATPPLPDVTNPCDSSSRPRYRTGKYFEASFDLDGPSPLMAKVLGVPHPGRFRIEDSLRAFIAKNLAIAH